MPVNGIAIEQKQLHFKLSIAPMSECDSLTDTFRLNRMRREQKREAPRFPAVVRRWSLYEIAAPQTYPGCEFDLVDCTAYVLACRSCVAQGD
ncbi:Lysine-specific demethylase 9 [Clarias magur]|uniref:Lysine-specific demethylase 9 n=1 Tax=Clarias magur TaxID=1594786 RepID=A0A8J4U822_CLAMG|nr:Lysine-specific demethylase 9 [Clarias magur]